MKVSLASKRKMRPYLAASVAAGLFTAGVSHAATLYDGVTGESFVYTGGTADEYMGNGITLPAGATDITAFDCLLLNATGMNLSAAQINIYVWGGVNLGTISSSTPAFSNELAEYTLDIPETFMTGYYYTFANGSSGGITLNTPLVLPSNSIGITFNYQGSTNGTTYSSMAGLTSLIGFGATPTVGTNARGTSSFDLAAQGETNGNYISGPYAFNQSTYTNQVYAARIYGDIASSTPDYWLHASDGTWTDITQWSNNAPPGGGTSAIFNLNASSGGYLVEIPSSVAALNVYVQNDNVQFDLDAQSSTLSVNKVLSVGQPSVAGNAATGTLVLENFGGIYTGVVQPGSIVVGGNGGTGSINVSQGVYLYSNGDTAINANSKLIIGNYAKFGTATLTIAGTTNAWTGQVDIGPTAMVIRNGSIGTVVNQILTGYANGKWTGQGITSSMAAADTTHLTAVGAIVNSTAGGAALYGSGTALGLFDGEAPAATAVLVRYTYFGDANLDGKVDGSDYSLIDNGVLNHLTGWYNGDFNYDGVVNGSDYTLIDNAYNQQGTAIPFNFATSAPGVLPDDSKDSLVYDSADPISLSSSAVATALPLEDTGAVATTTAEIAAVPEPTSLGILALSVAPLLRRRPRRVLHQS